MAKVTPAHIRYTPTNPDGSEGQEQVIDFHTVISEDHQASAQVTKYPVQTGFHISTNSIRNNRIVSIQGAISNTAMDFIPTTTQKTVARDYGEDSQRVVFQALEALVNSGTKVKVVTNLGVYEPVVFTKFQTKQKEGMVDSMHFTITGEEIIEYDEENYSAPVPLTFSTKSGVEREKIVRELEEYSMYVGPCDELSQANVRIGEDFVITGKDKAGNNVKTTYKFTGYDPVSGEANYKILVDEEAAKVEKEVEEEATNSPCAEDEITLDTIWAGIKEAGSCFASEAFDIFGDFTESLVDTALGKLNKEANDFYYGLTAFSGDKTGLGSSLAKAGVGCVVRTATGSERTGAYTPGESLPDTEDVMSKTPFREDKVETMTITQIQCACEAEGEEEEEGLFDSFSGLFS